MLEGGAAVGPAVICWSTPSSGHAARVSDRPAAAILMLIPGVVDACVACGQGLCSNIRMAIFELRVGVRTANQVLEQSKGAVLEYNSRC